MRLAVLPLAGVLATMVSLLFPRGAAAESKTEFLITQLKTSDEFRVRTQAALALGASKDDLAVAPLCDALDDANEAVRSASAAALAKLSKEPGLPCLRARDPKETDDKVKAQIARSIKTLAGKFEAADKPQIPPNARWYVSVGKITNKTSRPADVVETVVRQALVQKLKAMDAYGISPKGEAPAAAKRVMQSKKLKGFEFQVIVEAPAYTDAGVSLTLRVLITTYPGKDIKAASSPKISQQGGKRDDPATEDTLIKLLLEDSLAKFDGSIESL
jgi:hypothetical protein